MAFRKFRKFSEVKEKDSSSIAVTIKRLSQQKKTCCPPLKILCTQERNFLVKFWKLWQQQNKNSRVNNPFFEKIQRNSVFLWFLKKKQNSWLLTYYTYIWRKRSMSNFFRKQNKFWNIVIILLLYCWNLEDFLYTNTVFWKCLQYSLHQGLPASAQGIGSILASRKNLPSKKFKFFENESW